MAKAPATTHVQKLVQLKKTTHGEIVQVDATRLTRPSRTMACNILDARREGSSVEIAFGQRNPASANLVGALVVGIPVASLPLLLSRDEQPTFLQRLRTYLAAAGVSVPRMQIEASQYPERLVFERASVMSMSFVDHEADIRFFRMLPTEFRKMQQDQQYTADFLQPVVEVALSTEHLACLVEKLDALMDQPAPEGK